MLSTRSRPKPVPTTLGWLALLGACLLVPVACGNGDAWRWIPASVILVAPGWLVAGVALERERRSPQMAVGALAFSMALLVIATLALDRVPARLHAVAWAAGAGTVTASLLLAWRAWRHRARIRSHGRLAPIRFRHAAVLTAAFAVLNVAIAVARHGAAHASDSGASLLWMVPSASDNSQQLDLGIQNYGQSPQTFVLTLLADDSIVGTWDGIVVSPGKTWRQAVLLPDDEASDHRIEARLSLADHPNDVYRRVFSTPRP